MNKSLLESKLHQKKLEYYRNWRANNKDKVKQHNKNFWLKKLKEEEENARI